MVKSGKREYFWVKKGDFICQYQNRITSHGSEMDLTRLSLNRFSKQKTYRVKN